MLENSLELEYLRVLKKILIINTNPRFHVITKGYDKHQLTEDAAYGLLSDMSGNYLPGALNNGILTNSLDRVVYPIYNERMSLDLSKGFPLITTRRIPINAMLDSIFIDKKDHNFLYVVAQIVEALKSNSEITVSIKKPRKLLHFYRFEGDKLNCIVSPICEWDDIFNIVPSEMAFFAILTSVIAYMSRLQAKELTFIFNIGFINARDIEKVQLQLSREPYASPILCFNPFVDRIEDFKRDSISIEDYRCYAKII